MSNNSIINLFTTSTDYITANSNANVTITNNVGLNANYIDNVAYLGLSNGVNVGATSYGIINAVQLPTTVVNDNLVITYNTQIPILTFSNGATNVGAIYYDSNFGITSNINMTNNEISNIAILRTDTIAPNNYAYVSIKSGAPLAVDIIEGNTSNPIIINDGLRFTGNAGYSEVDGINTLTSSNISTINISSSVIYSQEIYTQIIGNPNPYGNVSIRVNNGLDLQQNNISNVNKLNAFQISSSQVFLSSVNNKPLNFNSTLFGVPQSTFTISGSSAGSNGVNNFGYVLYSNVKFPRTGNFGLQQKAVYSKISGGASATGNGVIFYTPGRFVSTFNQQDGMASLPILNTTGISTFTTLQSGCYVSTGVTTYNIIYYDATANNYTASLQLGNCLARYFPSGGNGFDY